MSDTQQQTIGIVIKADGTVELANGMKVTAAEVKSTATQLDNLGSKLDVVEAGEKKVSVGAKDVAEKMGEAGAAAVEAGKSIVEGDFAGAARKVADVGSATSGMSATMLASVGVIGAVAIGVGAAAFAAFQGAAEYREFNNTLILTGNYAGVTADRLMDVAARIDGQVGTQRQAAAALNQVVGTGKVAAQQLEEVSAAAIAMERATGTSVESTIANFVKLAEAPVKASVKLNESMNYLSAATYQRIRELEEQGRKEEAAALAQSTYAAAVKTRADQVAENVGAMARAWRYVRETALEAWDAMAGIGRKASMGEQLKDAQARLAYVQRMGGNQAPIRAEIDGLSRRMLRSEDNAAAEGQRRQDEQEKISALERLEAQKRATRSRAEQRAEEIAQLDRDSKRVGMAKAEYDKRVSDINEKYKDKKAPTARAYHDDGATRYLQELRDRNAAVMAQLDISGKATDAQKRQAEFLQQIADLKEKKILTVDQKSFLLQADAIKAQLQENVVAEDRLRIKTEEERKEKQRLQDLKEYKNTLAGVMVAIESSQQGRNDQYDRTLSAFGMGSVAREQVESTKTIYREFQRYQEQATKSASLKGALGSQEYRDDVTRIKAALDIALRDHSQYYADLKVKQGEWSYGATEAFANYQSAAADVAGQTKELFTDAFKNMEDASVSFAKTGKISFDSLTNSIIDNLIRIQVRAAMSGAMGSGGSGLTGMFGQLLNGFFGGGTTSIAGANLGNGFVRDVGMNAAGAVPMAKGGVWNTPGVSAYSSQIVSSPTFFAFAKGTGLMGEAGPEAIMPLRRGADGSLGVVASGGAGAAAPHIEVHVHNNGKQADAQVTTSAAANGGFRVDVFLDQIEDALADKVGNGAGNLSRAMEGRYGLRTAVS